MLDLAPKTVSLKNFSLLSFTGELTPEGLEKVEYVASSWISWDPELGSCVVQCMGPPYNAKNNKLLNDLIKAQAPAPADWPSYPIELKGHAETYTEANKRINILKSASYAFTTDSETHGKEQAESITELHKNKSKESVTVEDIINISKSLSSDDEDIVPGSPSNSDEDSSESSDESDVVKARKNRGRKTAESATPAVTKRVSFSKKTERMKKTKKANHPKKANITKKADPPKKADLKKADLPKKADLDLATRAVANDDVTKNADLDIATRAVANFDVTKNADLDIATRAVANIDVTKNADLDLATRAVANVDVTKNGHHSKNGVTSKHTSDTTQQQAKNHHFPPGEGIFELEKNHEAQSDALKEVVEGLPKDTAFMYVALKNLTVEVRNVATGLEALRSSIERSLIAKTKVDQVSIVHFKRKYSFQKLSTVAEYQAFDKRLLDDQVYVNDLKAAMECLVDSDLQRTITRTIRRIFQRDLAMKCTAFRQSKEKLLLKGTKFYDVLFVFVGNFHKRPDGGVVTEKEFYNTLSACLTNSKDWDGHRKNRLVQPPAAVMAENTVVPNPENPVLGIPEGEVAGNQS